MECEGGANASLGDSNAKVVEELVNRLGIFKVCQGCNEECCSSDKRRKRIVMLKRERLRGRVSRV